MNESEITPSKIRAHFLKNAFPLVDEYIGAALGTSRMNANNAIAQNAVWEILKQIILEAKNPAPMMDLRGKTIDEQVDKILTMVSEQKCTLDEGKEYLSLVQQGLELTEIPKMVKQMESLEALGIL